MAHPPGLGDAMDEVPTQDADAPDALLLVLFFIPWIVAPAAAAAMCSKASRTLPGAIVFLALETGVIVSTVLAWIHLIFVSPDAQNGIVLGAVLPLYQLGAVIAFVGAAYALGWRARTEWLNG